MLSAHAHNGRLRTYVCTGNGRHQHICSTPPNCILHNNADARRAHGVHVCVPRALVIYQLSDCAYIHTYMQVHESQIIGELGKGYKYAIEVLNIGRIGIGAQVSTVIA